MTIHPRIHDHWTAQLNLNENAVILMKFSSLAALDVDKMTNSSAASDENDSISISVCINNP